MIIFVTMEGLTGKQKRFCEEYIIDWNATRAAKAAGYSEGSAREIGSKNLTKVDIQNYISEIQENLEKIAGISRLSQVLEYKKIAYSSIAHLHNSWIDRKNFEDLTEDQKACIESIDTKIMKIGETEMTTEQIKIKLYDKQKALDSINKMLGYNEPEKQEIKLNSKKEINYNHFNNDD